MRPEVESLPERGLINGSLTESLFAAGLVPFRGEEWAEISWLDTDTAETMGREAGQPFLRLTSLVANSSGQTIEHVVSLLDPAHFRLHLRFGGATDEQ
jgi:GntR family transcriptional regulator